MSLTINRRTFFAASLRERVKKKTCNLSGWGPSPLRAILTVCGHSDFMQVFYCINIYVFETRKVWKGWFWKKKKLALMEKFNILRKYCENVCNRYPCKNVSKYFCIFFCFRTFKAFLFYFLKKLSFFSPYGK